MSLRSGKNTSGARISTVRACGRIRFPASRRRPSGTATSAVPTAARSSRTIPASNATRKVASVVARTSSPETVTARSWSRARPKARSSGRPATSASNRSPSRCSAVRRHRTAVAVSAPTRPASTEAATRVRVAKPAETRSRCPIQANSNAGTTRTRTVLGRTRATNGSSSSTPEASKVVVPPGPGAAPWPSAQPAADRPADARWTLASSARRRVVILARRADASVQASHAQPSDPWPRASKAARRQSPATAGPVSSRYNAPASSRAMTSACATRSTAWPSPTITAPASQGLAAATSGQMPTAGDRGTQAGTAGPARLMDAVPTCDAMGRAARQDGSAAAGTPRNSSPGSPAPTGRRSPRPPS